MMLFRQKQEKREFAAKAPDGVRVYAIGDIHGRHDLLLDLMERIDRDADMPHRIIFLGDYVDRGETSADVLEHLITLKRERGDDIVLLRGNHEQAMLDFIAAPEETVSWIEWGGGATLQSYGIDKVVGEDPEDLRDRLIERLPDSHFRCLMDLANWHVEGDYIFVHAGMRAGIPLEQQREEDLLWIRNAFFEQKPGAFGQTCIVHGHTPNEDTPLDVGWRVNVDTGAVWTGKLTAVALEGTHRRFIST